ncbi:hypothetical protein [Alcaligenes faecalis]|uniref:hypothetical protein n=1 Tax=Alcaligenes faecalis TaxID=511 RepID=UPI003F68931F
MVRKYFGTDGIRGKANEGAMTAETALRVGMAAGRVFRRGDHRHRVVIGSIWLGQRSNRTPRARIACRKSP